MRVRLGGSWVVVSGVISRVSVIITHIRGRIAPFITTHEPPSKAWLAVLCKAFHAVDLVLY